MKVFQSRVNDDTFLNKPLRQLKSDQIHIRIPQSAIEGLYSPGNDSTAGIPLKLRLQRFQLDIIYLIDRDSQTVEVFQDA